MMEEKSHKTKTSSIRNNLVWFAFLSVISEGKKVERLGSHNDSYKSYKPFLGLIKSTEF